MRPISKYMNFIREKGRPLSEINPGSNEIALSVDDAWHALDLLIESRIAVVGGDILTEDTDGNLAYVLHSWGYEYCYLNWSTNRIANESPEEYAQRSYEAAKEAIRKAEDVAKRLDKKCYIVLVL